MGFGFNLFFIFIILPGIIITFPFLLIYFIKSNNERKVKLIKVILTIFISFILALVILSCISKILQKIKVDHTNIYGEYIIDRGKYPGKQADWQYNSFKFELRTNHKLYFYEMENGIVKKVTIVPAYFCQTNHLALVKDSTNHHIISDNPTLYRETFNFYYVFKSPKFGNVFFKKGNWKKLD